MKIEDDFHSERKGDETGFANGFANGFVEHQLKSRVKLKRSGREVDHLGAKKAVGDILSRTLMKSKVN